MNIIKYPDGSSYVKEDNYGKEIVFRLNTYEDLWHLNQYVDVCNHNGHKPTVMIPNLIDTQADRRFNNNESFGLKLVCKFLNSMNANFKVFHPHNPEVVEALMDNVEIIDNSEFIKKVLDILSLEEFRKADIDMSLEYFRNSNLSNQKDNLLLMSSDAGGFKPLIKLCDKISWKGDTYSGSKSRNPLDGKLTQIIDRQDFEGKDILIVDDICVYGKTFKGLSKMLRERNVGKLYLAISHMTVQNLGEDSVTDYFDTVFCTNSKYDEYNWGNCIGNGNPKNLEIIKLF